MAFESHKGFAGVDIPYLDGFIFAGWGQDGRRIASNLRKGSLVAPSDRIQRLAVSLEAEHCLIGLRRPHKDSLIIVSTARQQDSCWVPLDHAYLAGVASPEPLGVILVDIPKADGVVRVGRGKVSGVGPVNVSHIRLMLEGLRLYHLRRLLFRLPNQNLLICASWSNQLPFFVPLGSHEVVLACPVDALDVSSIVPHPGYPIWSACNHLLASIIPLNRSDEVVKVGCSSQHWVLLIIQSLLDDVGHGEYFLSSLECVSLDVPNNCIFILASTQMIREGVNYPETRSLLVGFHWVK